MRLWTTASLIILFLGLSDGPSLLASDDVLAQVNRLTQQGDYDQAELLLRQTSQGNPYVLRLRIELAMRRGMRDEVERLARRLFTLYQSNRLEDSDELAQAAYAAWQLGLWHDANQILIEASQLEKVGLSTFVDWGNLYLERYNAAEAESIFRQGIQSGHRPSGYRRWETDAAYLGLARALRNQFKEGALEAVDKALELNPGSLEAMAFKAFLALEDNRSDRARKWIGQGLESNPSHLPLLELKCALHYLGAETERFDQARQQILQINPRNGSLFETLADLAVVRRRLQEAVEFYQESIRRDPRRWSALASLGINLLRLGKEDEGKAILEEAYSNDPFNIWTVNTLRLLDSFDQFARSETAHFRVKLHRKEAAPLRPYVEELLELSLRTLEEKYSHQITGKYVFEMYPDHEDFAVRTLGIPGLGAFGATFGRIVAMDSPTARPRRPFHWGSTLWHEVAHVVTLSLSNHKVPRWFTEGISMMEERQAGQGWGDYLNVGFVRAYQNGGLLPIAALDSGFQRPQSPQQLALSYFQAGWICEFLAGRYGFEKLRDMLVAFGQGNSTEEVFQQVLGKAIADVDRLFRKELDQTLRPLVKALEMPNDLELAQSLENVQGTEGEDDLQTWVAAYLADPENYFLNLRVGRKLRELGRNEEAVAYLEKALELFPTMAGKQSPYELLAQIYADTEQDEKTLQIRQEWWKMAPHFVDNAREMIRLLIQSGATTRAARYLKETMYVDPLHPDSHKKLGDLYLELGQANKAVQEYEIFLNLEPVDIATAHYKLAKALLESGDHQGARQHVLLSLEIAPSYQEAQRLLLKVARR